MKRTARLAPLLIAALFPFFAPVAARADVPGNHPYYLHALTDLRAARWLIEHRPSDAKVGRDEAVALQRIVDTIEDIKAASIDDGKDLRDHPPVDGTYEHSGSLHRAEQLLVKVHSDIAREEDDPMTRGLRDRAVHHLDEAIHATRSAIRDAEMGR